jgi:hydroxypyruvate reductase
MLSAESFWTSSLRRAPEGERVTRILAAAITAVEPGAAVRHFVQREGDLLTISGWVYDLR